MMQKSLILAVMSALAALAQNQVTAAVDTPAARQSLSPQLLASTGFGDSVIAHVADGAGWRTSITALNLRQTPTTFSIFCNGDNGGTQSFNWVGTGSASLLNGTLQPGGALVIATTGTASALSVGWCYISSPGSGPNPSTQPRNDVGAFAVFSFTPTGQEVSVPASHWFLENTNNALTLAFDNTNGYSYGVALADSNPFPLPGLPNSTVTVTITDQTGHVIGTDSFQMASSSHLSFVLTQRYPALANTQGTITFTSHTFSGIGTLAGIGIRAAPSGAFTSVTMLEPATY
jgi:hypothetical protein